MKHRYAITVAATGLAATAAVASLGLTTAARAATTTDAATTASAAAPRSVSPARPGQPRTIVAVRHQARPVAKIATRVVLDCAGRARVKPSSYLLACADAGMGLQSVRWTSWAPMTASGYGTFYENTCTPDCASGHFRRYPVLATLWGASGVAGHPADLRYTRLTLLFTGDRPPLFTGPGQPAYPITQTFDTSQGPAQGHV
jgi:hypothetical protein